MQPPKWTAKLCEVRATRLQLAGPMHLAWSSHCFAREGWPLPSDASAALGDYIGRHRAGVDGSLRHYERECWRAVEAVSCGSRCFDFAFTILPPLIVAIVLSGGFTIAGAVSELLDSLVQCDVARLGIALLLKSTAMLIRSAAVALARLGEARGPLPSA